MKNETLASRIKIAAVLVLAGLCWVVADGMRERLVAAGDKAPQFKVTTDTGKQVTRSEFGGKVLVLNFWATWCPPCVDEFPSLDAMARDLSGKGVVVLGVSVDTNQQTYQRFLQRMRPGFETARDPEANVSADYGTFKFPETYIIDSTGKVRMKYIGPRDWNDPQIRREIESLL